VPKKVTKKSTKKTAAKKVTRKPAKKVTRKPAKKVTRRPAKKRAAPAASMSKQVDARIKAIPGWQGKLLAQVRRLIKQAEPDVVETLKWAKASNAMAGVPVWEHDGIICTGETYKDKVKLTFARGASVADPTRLFNSSLDGNTRRAIDFFEGDTIDAKVFKNLIRAAADFNESQARR
jgi:hypothetical protein